MKQNLRLTVNFVACLLSVSVAPCFSAPATGVVTDPAGKPIAGATVYIISIAHLEKPLVLKTDQKGVFTADILDPTQAPGRETLCMIDAKGYALSGGTIVPGPNQYTPALAVTLTGLVVDSKGAPVPGCKVTPRYAAPSMPSQGAPTRFSFYEFPPVSDSLSVTTDSSGKYAVGGIPPDEMVGLVITKQGFVQKSIQSTKGLLIVPQVVLLPGTSIKGRVLLKNGKPAAGVLVAASIQGSFSPSPVHTGADGRYEISGLTAGSYTVSVVQDISNTVPPSWLAPAPIQVAASINAATTAPDITLSDGNAVTGTVIDSQTKQPLAGISVGIQRVGVNGQMPVNTSTDSSGTFKTSLGPGTYQVYLFNLPPDYSNGFGSEANFKVIAGRPVIVDPIALQKLLTVSGTLSDSSGKPIPEITLQTQKLKWDGTWAQIPPAVSAADGTFTIHGLNPGSYYVDPGLGWTVTSPISFDAPVTGPINIVLTKKPLDSLSGTVVDLSGAPIAGVRVEFGFRHALDKNGTGFTFSSAVTDVDGKYTIAAAPTSAQMILSPTIQKDGYDLESGGDVTSSRTGLTVSPIVVVQSSGIISGVVKNELGQPVADAWVFCPSSTADSQPVKTNSAGQFTLTGQYVGPVRIYAAKGAFFGDQTAAASPTQSDTTVSLNSTQSSPNPTGTVASVALLNLIYAAYLKAQPSQKDNTRMRDLCVQQLACTDHVAALDFIGQFSEVNTGDLASIIPAPAADDPAATAAWAVPLLLRTVDNGNMGQVASALGLAIAPYDPASAAKLYDMSYKAISLHHFDQKSIQNGIQLDALAYAVHRPEADDIYAKIRASIDSLNAAQSNKQFDWYGESFAEFLALGNTDIALKYLATLDPSDQYQVMPWIVQELVRPYPDAALRVFKTLSEDNIISNEPYAYAKSFCCLIPILMRQNAVKTIAEARALTETELRSQALTEIADLLPLAQAAPLYKEAEAETTANLGQDVTPASIAAHALLRDRALGKDLFTDAYNKVIPSTNHIGPAPMYSEFAFYYARLDPAFSRMLIEKQFQIDLRAKNYIRYRGDCTVAECAAMAAVNIDRALQMASQIPDSEAQYRAGVDIANYVLESPSQRNTISFTRWMDNYNGTFGPPGIW